MQQMNSAFKISIILMKRELNDYQKLAKALIKWNRFTMKMK